MRCFAVVAVCCAAAFGQIAPVTGNAFEVASVKPTEHGRDANGMARSFVDTPNPETLRAQDASLRELLEFAFHLESYQLTGPAWLNDDSECFDIEAKTSAGTTKAQFRSMLAALLAERFHLAFHRETKPFPAYNLVADAHGESLRVKALHKPKPDDKGGGIWSAGGNVLAR